MYCVVETTKPNGMIECVAVCKKWIINEKLMWPKHYIKAFNIKSDIGSDWIAYNYKILKDDIQTPDEAINAEKTYSEYTNSESEKRATQTTKRNTTLEFNHLMEQTDEPEANFAAACTPPYSPNICATFEIPTVQDYVRSNDPNNSTTQLKKRKTEQPLNELIILEGDDNSANNGTPVYRCNAQNFEEQIGTIPNNDADESESFEKFKKKTGKQLKKIGEAQIKLDKKMDTVFEVLQSLSALVKKSVEKKLLL